MPTWKLWLILSPICLAIDLFYLGVVMKDFYARELGDLARRQGGSLAPHWGAALLVYVLIPAGLVLFARPLPASTATVWSAMIRGATFGLVLYGVYDLTNLATLERWTLRLTIADIAWGTTLCGVCGVIMHFLDK